MRVRGWKSARQVARWARSRLTARALILGYHRVADEPTDPFSLCVSPENFRQQLDVILHYGHPVGLGDLVEAMSSDARLDRSVGVTFDDGYVDVLTSARPLLTQARVPATVFVVTGLLGREFWWDALWRTLQIPNRLPDRLCLPMNGGALEWASPDAHSDARRDLLFKLHARLAPLSDEQRQEALGELSIWAGVRAEKPTTRRALEPDEVIELARGDLIEVGAHGSTHASLPALDADRQRSEIQGSKTDLERLIGRPVVSFSYPHGGWSPQTTAIVRGSGYARACTSTNDLVRPDSDCFELPRFWVPNWSGERFSRWLAWWLGHPSGEGS